MMYLLTLFSTIAKYFIILLPNGFWLRQKLKRLEGLILLENTPACITMITHNDMGVVYLCACAGVWAYALLYLNITEVPRFTNYILFCFLFSAIRIVFLLPYNSTDYTYEEHVMRLSATAAIARQKKMKIICPNKCGRSYKRMEHMKRHLAHECGIDPKYECQVCQRKFVYIFSMKKHMSQMHKGLFNDSNTVYNPSHQSPSTSHA